MSKYWNKPSNKKREQNEAKVLGGERVSGSGNTPWRKEDIITPRYLVQHKETEGRSISVKFDDLVKLHHNAIDEGKEPLFVLKFGNRRYYILNQAQFYEFDNATAEL